LEAADRIELARRIYDAWAEGGFDEFLGFVHPEIEYLTPPQAPEPGPYRGYEGLRELRTRFEESFDWIEFVPEELLPGSQPDQLVALVHTRSRARKSGLELDMANAHLLTFRDGKLIRLKVFLNRRAALTAAGIG
jgi:ketosteroid isomerase-like protein